MSSEEACHLLEISRRQEKEQALVYRSLAARAEAAENPDLAQRFHDLHADEQHHLSRLTARVLELAGRPIDLSEVTCPVLPLEGWEPLVRDRERIEIDRYESLLDRALDPTTQHLLQEILSTETHHLSELGGKWTPA
jgi:rubrerythrin